MSKTIHILLLFLLISIAGTAQPNKSYSVVSLMDGEGTFVTDSNTLVNLPLWGYGLNQSQPSVVLPGPTIYANEGDSVYVEMVNPSMEGHTIHLHGLDVDEANDGVPHYTGFIQQGESFTYRFLASHAGNFLYHCHVTTTMHLALGMYGMVIVYPADSSNRLYTNGPEYDRQHEYLLSDMDARWNADYTSIGGFLTYDPDLYLINGKNKQFVYQDTHMLIQGGVGDQHLMRLLNVGYRVNRVIFPAELNAVVHMSDGRVLDTPFSADTLFIYPGERYSVLAEIVDESASFVSVDYLDPYRLRFLGREYIPVNDDDFEYFKPAITDVMIDSVGVAVDEVSNASINIFPNPTDNEVWVSSALSEIARLELFDVTGRKWIEMAEVNTPLFSINVMDLPTGIYFLQMTLNNGDPFSERLIIH